MNTCYVCIRPGGSRFLYERRFLVFDPLRGIGGVLETWIRYPYAGTGHGISGVLFSCIDDSEMILVVNVGKGYL